ncbi:MULTISPECIES: TadE/TadG family type IV pilus assembly protein [Bacillus]|uniref:TadE/TadG family type IV pilus assembly protein n=1 Tax=Bacillus TaxID=1386 RepID=UPI0012FF4957|nr:MULTISPECIES: pilus assembly protein TadG-related protein [Bacillus]
MKKIWKQEDGAVIVLVALFMTILLGCVGLVVDMGSIYLEKNRLQKMVDAAVLAGAQELPDSFDRARTAVAKTITLNGGDPSNFHTSTNELNTVLEVTGSTVGTFYFATLFGVTGPDIVASAKVTLHALTSGKGAIPLGISKDQNLSFGTHQVLKVSESASGNFGALALTGTGARLYETDLTYGYQHELNVNDVLNTETGRMANPTVRAVESRINKCPQATYENYLPDCARVVLIPVIEPVEISSNQIKQVKVIGFATFFLEAVSSTSDGAEVSGRFIQFTKEGGTSSVQPNYGTYGMKLSE